MKRILFLLTLLLIVTTNTWAEEIFQVGDFLYTITDEVNKKVEVKLDYDVRQGGTVTNVDIPATVMNNNVRYSVTSLGDYAFSGCKSLTQVTIPNSVTSIGKKAFWGCTFLKSISLNNGLKEIGDEAFFLCKSITEFTIPSSVTSLGKQLFSINLKFKKMTVLATVPPTATDETFSACHLVQVYVPAKSLKAYKAAEGWKELKLNAL